MNVNRWLIGVILLIAVSACSRRTDQKPNVVLISIDTLSALHMSIYDYGRDTTPFLSRLAKEAAVFENTYAQSTHTTASHYSMFTGRYPQGHKVLAEYSAEGMKPNLPPLSASIPTLTQYLKAAGYSTQMAGTYYDSELAFKRGLDRGFDGFTNLLLQWHQRQAATQTLLEKLGASKARPFFFFIHTYMVHAPYCEGAGLAREFNPGFTRKLKVDCQSLVAAALKKPAAYGIPDPREMNRLFDPLFDTAKPEDVKELVALYDGGVREADKFVEAVVEKLKASGDFENTIFIVTSDHGEAFGEHGQFKHISAFREILRIPLIIKIPGRKPVRVKEEALSIDIVPTVLEALGIRPTGTLDGLSLLPALDGRKITRRGARFALSIDEGAVWEDQWKLVSTNADGNRLYDILSDPLEKIDLAKSHPDVMSRLVLKLNAARLESRAR